MMKRAFFEAPVETVAPRLLGKMLARRTRAGWMAGRIVEVEAYLGPHNDVADRAAHSHRGPTPRNRVLFGPAGHAYVYSIYGMYYCMNITCEPEGRAGCILLRALEPLTGLKQMARNRGLERPPMLSVATGAPGRNGATRERLVTDKALRELAGGPSRLCQALDLTRDAHNGLDLLDAASPLQVWDDGTIVRQVLVTTRIGIRHAAELPLRFAIPKHSCVSGPRNQPGKYIFLKRLSASTIGKSTSRSPQRTQFQNLKGSLP
jgi:DNA-3-methyladenine glycosylase